jgi:hypothetical protein
MNCALVREEEQGWNILLNNYDLVRHYYSVISSILQMRTLRPELHRPTWPIK